MPCFGDTWEVWIYPASSQVVKKEEQNSSLLKSPMFVLIHLSLVRISQHGYKFLLQYEDDRFSP